MTRQQDASQPDAAPRDITLRLADAADECEIGIAPYEAVLRGGRRRRTRRWVIGTLAAVTLAGSTGSLALAVVDGGHGPARTRPATGTPQDRHVYSPWRTALTEVPGKDPGKRPARVELQLWGAPKDDAEARGQRKAMTEAGVWDERATDPAPAFDRPWFALVTRADGKTKVTSFGLEDEHPGGTDGLSFASVKVELNGRELTVGHVGPKTRRVEYAHEHGTTEPPLRKVPGSGYLWFTRESGEPAPQGSLQAIRIEDGEGGVQVIQED